MRPPARAVPSGVRRFLHRLLQVPLLYKILVANAAIVTAGAVAGTVIALGHGARHPGAPHYDLMAALAAAGVGVSLVANYLVLRLVLRPLGNLQAAVDAVRTGQSAVRVARAGPTDDRLEHLADTFDQMVAALEDHAERLRLLPGQILRAQERVRELRELTVRALEDVRRIALELRPSVLDDLGLASALATHVDALNAAGGMRVQFEDHGLDGRLPSDVELALYRVAQEALTNVRRHARAAQAWVPLRHQGPHVSLQEEDNGVGFDPARASAAGGGLGLAGMQERMTLVGGSLTIRSGTGRGTTVEARADLTARGGP